MDGDEGEDVEPDGSDDSGGDEDGNTEGDANGGMGGGNDEEGAPTASGAVLLELASCQG